MLQQVSTATEEDLVAELVLTLGANSKSELRN